MALSNQAARRKEYPEMGEDFRVVQEEDPVSHKMKTNRVRVPVKITTTFWFTFRNPQTEKYERQALTYTMPKSRILEIDLRNWEAEIGVQPSMVQRELNYMMDHKKKLWVEIQGSKNSPDHYEDCTEEYFSDWRPDAYRGAEDPYKGLRRPKKIDVMEFRLHLMERRFALVDAREKNHMVPMFLHNTSTQEQTGVTKSQFDAPPEGTPVANVAEFIRES